MNDTIVTVKVPGYGEHTAEFAYPGVMRCRCGNWEITREDFPTGELAAEQYLKHLREVSTH